MSEEQQQSTGSVSRAETIELLQGTARRFEELVKDLKNETIDYQLPKRSYKTLLKISEQIFNAIEEASGSAVTNSLGTIDFDDNYSDTELLQIQIDFFKQMVEKMTSESIDYQLPISDFETLVATTEKIVNPFGTPPTKTSQTFQTSQTSQTSQKSSDSKADWDYSDTKVTTEPQISKGINWPWLGFVVIILILVISLTALFSNQKSVTEEIAIEVPTVKLESTAEQKAIAAIAKQIETIVTTSNLDGIASIKPNFVPNTLILELADNWQELERDEKEKIANQWLAESRKLEFKKLEIIDRTGVLVARSPLIGKNIIIEQP